jgi:hypothetical protein
MADWWCGVALIVLFVLSFAFEHAREDHDLDHGNTRRC